MEKIYFHAVSIYREQGEYDWEKDSFEIEESNVLIENDKFVILDDDDWTKLEKGKHGYLNPVIGKENITISINDHYSRDGVSYTLYSDKKLSPATIKKHIKKKVEEKCGWLMNALDLSIIK